MLDIPQIGVNGCIGWSAMELCVDFADFKDYRNFANVSDRNGCDEPTLN
jgi:hypothetical protein